MLVCIEGIVSSMGRFLTSRAVQPVPVPAGRSSAVATKPAVAVATAPPSKPAITIPTPSVIQVLGCYVAGAYVVSGYATDVSLHLLGEKPYLSVISGLATLVLFAL